MVILGFSTWSLFPYFVSIRSNLFFATKKRSLAEWRPSQFLFSLHYAAQKGYASLVEFLIKKHNATIDSLTMVRPQAFNISKWLILQVMLTN
jgi:hypothetical protein